MTENAIEPEVVDETQDFDKKLIRKVVERDNRHCQLCGAGEDELQPPHHVDKRGMGGSPSKNDPQNLITLCGDCHEHVEAGRIIVKKWNPDDKEDGLHVKSVVDIGNWRSEGQFENVPKDFLYFYHIPSQELIKTAHHVHNELKEKINQMLENFHSSLELLYWIKNEELFRGIEKNEDEFYQSFGEYYQNEVIVNFSDDRKGPLALSSVQSYLSSLPPIMDRVEDKEERKQIPRGNLPALASILRDENISEDEKQQAIESSKGNQREFKKLKRDLKTGSGSADRLATCHECMIPEGVPFNQFSDNGNVYKLGGRKMSYCPYLLEEKGETFLIQHMTKKQAEMTADGCPKYEPTD